MVSRNVWVAWAVILFLAAPGCGRSELGKNSQGDRTIKARSDSTSADTLFYLDLARPSITQAIEPRSASSKPYEFVQVEVAAVTNPNQRPLSFEVRFQRNREVPSYLGTFSLYPSDNPGTFIVATQGKVGNEGTIILSLVRPPQSSDADHIRVGVKRIRFL